MNTFHKVPASKSSLCRRKPVYGVGVNDAWYKTTVMVDGKQLLYKPYQAWFNMLKRCYSWEFQNINRTYIGCSVAAEWRSFNNFETWYRENYIEGYDLDKDIKVKNNKVYGPNNCLFVPPLINKLLTHKQSDKGEYPTGVSFHKQRGKYRSVVSVDGGSISLGLFKTPELARAAYVIAKNEEIMRKCGQYPELKEYLLAHLEN